MFGSIWRYLKDPVNFAVISAIAGGSGAVFVYFHSTSEAKSPLSRNRSTPIAAAWPSAEM
jgi:hypothetical protein